MKRGITWSELLIVLAILMIVGSLILPHALANIRAGVAPVVPPRFTCERLPDSDRPGRWYLITDTHTGAEYLLIDGRPPIRLEPKQLEAKP